MFKGGMLAMSANYSSASGGVNRIPFDVTNEDVGGYVQNEVAGRYFRVPNGGAGVYHVWLSFASGSMVLTGTMQFFVSLTDADGTRIVAQAFINEPASSDGFGGECACVIRLGEGDELRTSSYQSSGANIAIFGGDDSGCAFGISLIGV